jgi:hypothetical protein
LKCLSKLLKIEYDALPEGNTREGEENLGFGLASQTLFLA